MNGEPITILLVEDDMAHAEIVRRNLESSRIANRLVHMKDGQSALDFLLAPIDPQDVHKNARPGMILLDLRLPKVDGLEVLKTIKSTPELMTIPVVVLTTSSAEADIAEAYEYRANSYLVKPVDFPKFVELMELIGFYWLVWNQQPFS